MSQTSDANHEQITEQKDKEPDSQAAQTDPVQSEASETPTSSRAKGRKSPRKKGKKSPRSPVARGIQTRGTSKDSLLTTQALAELKKKRREDSRMSTWNARLEALDSLAKQFENQKKTLESLQRTTVETQELQQELAKKIVDVLTNNVKTSTNPNQQQQEGKPERDSDLREDDKETVDSGKEQQERDEPRGQDKYTGDEAGSHISATYLLSISFVINKKEEPIHNKKNKLKGIRVVQDMKGIRPKDKISPPKLISSIKLRRLGNEARIIGIMLKEKFSGEFIEVKGLADTGANRNVSSIQAMEPYKVEVEDPIFIKETQAPEKSLRKATKVIFTHFKLTQAGDQVDTGMQHIFCIDNPAWDEAILAKVTPIAIRNLVDDIPEELNKIGIGEGNIEEMEKKESDREDDSREVRREHS
eukprot:augustus_masked-scaffold_23-processed-gene-0.57-mRNA-1 protein AED:1.00 eAED:1.00 QI:0/0/0/0/1/1/3/0/415